jgi:putative membrane protein
LIQTEETFVGKLKALLLIICALAVGLVCLAFVLQNQQSVVLNFLKWTTPGLPVSVYIICSMLFGMVIGPILFSVRRALRRKPRPVRVKAKPVETEKVSTLSGEPVLPPSKV